MASSSCLARAPDPLPQPPECVGGHRRRLGYRDALRLLDQSKATTKQVKQAHAVILRQGHHNPPATLLFSKLIRLYSSHRRLDLAVKAFSQLPFPPPTLAWNLLIRAHALNAAPRDAVLLYARMIAQGVPPDKFTFPFTAAACAGCAAAGKDDVRLGRQLHASAIKAGFYGNDPYVHNTLIHLYFTFGDSVSARLVFDRMRARTVVSWTAFISGLISSGDLDIAREAFDAMPVRNVVSWTALIDGYARNGRPGEAFELFWKMNEDNVRANEFTIVSLLIACTELGSLNMGRWVHDFARKSGGMESGVYVGTALIDMYSKCGSLEDALKVFDQMPVRSLATWNSMITSLGVHGRGREAIALFREMEGAGLRPDRITLVGVLCACARAGMVEEGFRLFRYMTKHYGITAGMEHYSCLLELCGCAEGSEEMCETVRNLTMELDAESQRMLLAASSAHGDIELQRILCSSTQGMASAEGCDVLSSQENPCCEQESRMTF